MRDPHGYRLLAFLFAIPAICILAATIKLTNTWQGNDKGRTR